MLESELLYVLDLYLLLIINSTLDMVRDFEEMIDRDNIFYCFIVMNQKILKKIEH